LTAEQQAEQDEYNRIMQEALGEIQKLSAGDYANDESTQKVLNAWEEENQRALQNSFEERTETEDKILAQRGLASSSAGEAARRRRLNDRQDAGAQLGREKDLISDDIRNERLALQQNLYNIASSRQDLDSAQTLRSATSGLSAISSINAGNRASIADYYSRQLTSQNSRLQNSNSGLFGNVVNGFLGTGLSPVNSVLGSIF
jgi:mevalonate pyrophosphate decarboxylase